MTIEVIPSKAALGADVGGVDISRPLSAAERDKQHLQSQIDLWTPIIKKAGVAN